MPDRLAEIEAARFWGNLPDGEQANWLIAEVKRLRTELATWEHAADLVKQHVDQRTSEKDLRHRPTD